MRRQERLQSYDLVATPNEIVHGSGYCLGRSACLLLIEGSIGQTGVQRPQRGQDGK